VRALALDGLLESRIEADPIVRGYPNCPSPESEHRRHLRLLHRLTASEEHQLVIGFEVDLDRQRDERALLHGELNLGGSECDVVGALQDVRERITQLIGGLVELLGRTLALSWRRDAVRVERGVGRLHRLELAMELEVEERLEQLAEGAERDCGLRVEPEVLQDELDEVGTGKRHGTVARRCSAGPVPLLVCGAGAVQHILRSRAACGRSALYWPRRPVRQPRR